MQGQLVGAAVECHLSNGPPPRRSGGRPRSPPSPGPGPPSPPPRCSMLSPGPPQRSTGAPPGSSPRAATRSSPADPAPPPRRPPPGPTPTRPEWAVQRGGGVRGASPPRGADTRKQPASRVSGGAHAGPARLHSESVPPRPGGCVSRGRSAQDSAAAGHPLPLPGPRGQRQLVIVQAQRAGFRGGRPPPSAPLVEASPKTQASESRGGGRGSAAPHSPRLPGPCAPSQVRGRGSGCACPTLSGLEEAHLDLWRRRPLAAHPENTPSHPATLGALIRLLSAVPSPPPAQAGPRRGSVLLDLPPESFAKRKVIAQREAALSPNNPWISPDRESSLRSGDVREAGDPAPPRPHYSPSATCAAAPAPARVLLQRRRLFAADPPALKPAPGSGLRAPV
ncbi:PREDICTED: basic salivary proline-rich protein 2-like [Ceratotherium simum simum]|uniref:Basic salivary proline-rich protein 2-like n=1 Tax=Ceratotherium simum simum TaxID=73337 RepID=A0ABM1CP29_CERSS|nr:PREDICTED: basic salivary proline-rich protein 2-like [Ceratotherium simum simum]